MKLVPWRPFGELRTLRREMEHSSSRSLDDTPFPRLVLGEWVPWVDISETKENVVVRAELPGLEVKDIRVSTEEKVLTIKGEKKREEQERDEHYHYTDELEVQLIGRYYDNHTDSEEDQFVQSLVR